MCLSTLLFVILCACCKKQQRKKIEIETTKKPVDSTSDVVMGGTGSHYQQVTLSFAVNVFKVISASSVTGAKPPSCVLSPYALEMSFAVCMYGANASTLLELENTLFPLCGTITFVEDVLKEMLESTDACRKDNLFRAFIRVYANSAIRYSAEFRKLIEVVFGGKFFVTEDYTNTTQMSTNTNRWLSTVTNGQLTEFTSDSWLPKNPRNSSLNVLSAATYDFRLKSPFPRNRTRSDGRFYIRAGKSIKIAMMRQVTLFGYNENETVQVLRLECLIETSVYVFLPRLTQGLEKLETKLTTDFLLAMCISTAGHKQAVEVSLPKFRMECEIGDSLVVALANLGLASSFKKGAADFSRILASTHAKDQHSLWISGAVHKTMIEFTDEEVQQSSGKEFSTKSGSVSVPTLSNASSVTSTKNAKAGGATSFNADHPFLFVVMVDEKMTPLFLGRYCGK